MSHRILIIDDNADIRWILSDMLQAHGYLCETAPNAISALTMIPNGRFDVIVTDYQMPKMNGLEFIQKLATLPESSTIPVIMVSGSAGQELTDSARLAGARTVLMKPVQHEELIAIIERIIHSQSQHSDTCPCA